MSKKPKNQLDFLLSFFKEPHNSFALIRVNGFVLNRYITPEGNAFVMIFTEDSFNASHVSKNHRVQTFMGEL